MLPMRFFRNRTCALADTVSLLMSLLAQYFQTVQDDSPLQSGLRFLPWTAMPMSAHTRAITRKQQRPAGAAGGAASALGVLSLRWCARGPPGSPSGCSRVRGMLAPAWPIETARLVLRPFQPGDLQYAIHSDEQVARHLYNDPRTLDEVQDLLERKIAGAAVDGEGQWLCAAPTLMETGELVGDVSLLWTSEHRQGELGFIVHPAHQGKGYATEATRPLLAFAFETLGLHRVVGRLEVRNVGSARVLEKLGMRREAHLVENEWVKGEWQSEFVYAILGREWTNTRLVHGGKEALTDCQEAVQSSESL
jgi:RimJ/RimL family protein N-acetyltransferase